MKLLMDSRPHFRHWSGKCSLHGCCGGTSCKCVPPFCTCRSGRSLCNLTSCCKDQQIGLPCSSTCLNSLSSLGHNDFALCDCLPSFLTFPCPLAPLLPELLDGVPVVSCSCRFCHRMLGHWQHIHRHPRVSHQLLESDVHRARSICQPFSSLLMFL